MATITSQNIKKYSLLAKGSVVVRASASATANLIRNVSNGLSVGMPTGKIVVVGLERWIEVMQIPFNNGFVNSSAIKILNEQKQEMFLSVLQTSATTYNISFKTTPSTATTPATTLSEPEAKSELDKFILNEQNVFSSLGRSQALLKKIPKTVNVTSQQNSINTLTERYNKRQQKINSVKGLQTSFADFNYFEAIAAHPPRPIFFNGLGAVQTLIVPVVYWALVGVTAIAVWAVVKSNKSEGLSDLKLSKDVENILSQKLSEEERKKVIAEFDKQRTDAFAEGKKAAGGTIGAIGNLLKWGVIGVVTAIVVKKYVLKK
ncbi:MAG: hypothetical protein FWE63_01960 [Bacteroidales bacterium]|nr:hypothetical protein [Bacteroidales bacterium]